MVQELPRAFDRVPDEYERGRPGYPDALIAYLRQTVGIGPHARVVDVGAGTGKFTRELVRTGAHVIAVEPVAGMRERCARELPFVPVLGGVAEALPLADNSARAVVAAQAFHWFASPAAVAEVHRVLVDEGAFVLVWNVRDERTPWVREMSKLLEPHSGSAPRYKDGSWRAVLESSGKFGSLWRASFEHAQVGAPGMVLDRVASVSYVAALDPAERARLLASVGELVRAQSDAGGQVTLPYVTEVWWTTARSRQPGRWGTGGCSPRKPGCDTGRK